uniref:Uncharacterized protein n=1 Tax=Brassica oleracea var. oleracea TaxID=109376 RepID=A0A0D3DLF8_BRAOL
MMRDELRTVVCYDLVWEPVSADYVLPDEILHLLVGDVGIGFGFDPLGEVVCENQDELLLARCRHWTDDVHSPSHEWVWSSQGMKELRWAV